MEEETENIKPEEGKSVEAKTLTEDITEFNKGIEKAIEELTAWKSKLLSLQEKFVEKLKAKTLSMKIK